MSEPHPYCTEHDQPLEWCAHHVLATSDAAGDLLWNIFGAQYPDWYHVSRQHWVMDLDWYKAVRRYMLQLMPDAEHDESKWVPGPDDTIFGYPIEVREDGGKPHLVSDHQDGPPFTHTLKLPDTEDEMAAEPLPSFTLEDGP